MAKKKIRAPTCFISYSWDNNDHKAWVLRIATDLREKGVDVTLDQWDLQLGDLSPQYMDQAFDKDFVLIICTRQYVKKTKRPGTGSHYEGTILQARILEKSDPRKIIPIYRESITDSPVWLKGKIGVMMINDTKYTENIEEILRHIFKKPEKIKPQLGLPPDFSATKRYQVLGPSFGVLTLGHLLLELQSVIWAQKRFGLIRRIMHAEMVSGLASQEFLDYVEKKYRYSIERGHEVEAKIDESTFSIKEWGEFGYGTKQDYKEDIRTYNQKNVHVFSNRVEIALRKFELVEPPGEWKVDIRDEYNEIISGFTAETSLPINEFKDTEDYLLDGAGTFLFARKDYDVNNFKEFLNLYFPEYDVPDNHQCSEFISELKRQGFTYFNLTRIMESYEPHIKEIASDLKQVWEKEYLSQLDILDIILSMGNRFRMQVPVQLQKYREYWRL